MPFLAPVFGAVAAFASTALGSIVLNVGLAIGASLLSSILAPQPSAMAQEVARPSGMRLSVAMGETTPLSFPVGYAATAGSRKYAMSWGVSGEVPNAYRTEVIQISDMPVPGLDGFWAFKQKCTIDWAATPTAQGYPVLEFRQDGIDYMWVKFRNGSETVADSFLVNTFGTHPTYPWTSEFIGRGTPHAIVTMLFNRELFKSDPTFLFEPTPTRFYDLRKDSTNGGSGSHRWNDQSTWEPTRNPVVITYNVIRGVYYNGVWVYGGRNLPAFRLPASSWMAAANECDAPRALAGGGTEPQFRCGMEINVNVEPLTTIEELMRSCNARMSEIGGIFEIMVGSPGAAVYSFTDASIMISRGQKYSSFPGLNDTHNAIEATYVEPGEMWVQRAAPPRYDAAYEAQDGGRRLATGVSLLAVPYGVQAQQIMKTLIEDDRRWRTHYFTLPPDAWILTGTCVVSWTSARNGYVNKKFLVITADGEPGMCQTVMLREIDPSDYAWASDDELPNPIGQLVIVRPAPQIATGFQAFPANLYDDDGIARRPSIGFTYDGNQPDIREVHVLVRLKSSGDYVYEKFEPYVVPYSVVLNGVFLPNTEYEIAIKYVPYTGRPTEFTSYQTVLTDDVKLVPGKDFDPFSGVIGFEQLGSDLAGYIKRLGMSARDIIKSIQEVSTSAADQELANSDTFQEVRQEVAVSFGLVEASFVQTITVAIVPLQNSVVALADYLTELSAGDGSDVSTARFRMTTISGASGYSTIAAQTRVDVADPNAWRGAAWFLETPNDPLLPTRFLVNADQFIVVSGSNTANPFVFDGTLRVGDALVRNASIGDAEITGAKIASATIGNANIGNAEITGAKIASATIETANIGTAQIDTLRIASGAVTATTSDAPANGPVSSSSPKSAAISIPGVLAGGVVQVQAFVIVNSAGGVTGGFFAFELYRNGSLIRRKILTPNTAPASYEVDISAIDIVPSAGTVTYSAVLSTNFVVGDSVSNFVLVGSYAKR